MALANMTAEETKNHNVDTCKHIAHELEAFANGQIVRCDECGETFDIYNDVPTEWETGDACPHCGGECYPEELSAFDWLDDALDITFTMGSDGEMRGARVAVTLGGPNIYVDTFRARVELFWWGDCADWGISNEACEALDEALRECFEMAKAC